MFTNEAVMKAFQKLEKKLDDIEKSIQSLKEQYSSEQVYFTIESKSIKNTARIDLKLHKGDVGVVRLPIKYMTGKMHTDNNGYYVQEWNISTMAISSPLKKKLESFSITPEGEENFLKEHTFYDENKLPDWFYETKLYLENGTVVPVRHVGYITFVMDGVFEEGKYWNVDMKVEEII
jgi:hypothetical protein